jgi:hypothetical protein
METLWTFVIAVAWISVGYRTARSAAEKQGRSGGWGVAGALATLLGAAWAFVVAAGLVLAFPEEDIFQYGNFLLVLIFGGGFLGGLVPVVVLRALPTRSVDQPDQVETDLAVPEPQVFTSRDRRSLDPRAWPPSASMALVLCLVVGAVAVPLALLPIGDAMRNLGPGPDIPEWVAGPDPMSLYTPATGLRPPEHPFAAPSHFVLTVMASDGSPSAIECLSEAFGTSAPSLEWVEYITTEGLTEDQAHGIVTNAFENPEGDPVARAWIGELIEMSEPGEGCLDAEVFSATFGRVLGAGAHRTFTHLVFDEMTLDEAMWGGVALLPGATLNCAGELVAGMGTGVGILVVGTADVTVTGCRIQNFQTGVVVLHSSQVRLSDITVRGTPVGISSQDSSLIVEDASILNASRGILVTVGSEPVEIRDVEVTASLVGVRVSSASNVLLSNLVVGGEGDGIQLVQGTTDVTVEESEITVASRGIVVQAVGSGIVLDGNVVTGADRGIFVFGSPPDLIARNNTCSDVDEPSSPAGLC